MQGFLQIIGVDGAVRTTVINACPDLQTLQGIVGGYIEVVPFYESHTHEGQSYRTVAFCNEEGKLNGLPFNREATKLWMTYLASHPEIPQIDDVLVGPIVIIFGDDELLDEM